SFAPPPWTIPLPTSAPWPVSLPRRRPCTPLAIICNRMSKLHFCWASSAQPHGCLRYWRGSNAMGRYPCGANLQLRPAASQSSYSVPCCCPRERTIPSSTSDSEETLMRAAAQLLLVTVFMGLLLLPL